MKLIALVIIKMMIIPLFNLDNMSFRKEKKFRFNKSELKLLKFSLIEKGMKVKGCKTIIGNFRN